MKETSFTLFSLILLFFSLDAVAGSEVFILHTNNTNGALENCLCPGKSYGSLEKRVLFVREWLREHPNTLVLDAGDFLSATSNTLKDSIAFRAYEMIPYDAVGLGDQEFLRGVPFLSDLMKDSELPFVSSNLERPQLPNVTREVVVSRSGIRFGILSVMDPAIFRFYPRRVSESVELAPYDDILENGVAALRHAVDVVVLLSHFGIDQDRELAKRFPGIDIIIGSHTQTVMEEPEKVGNTLIVQAGMNGYYVGRIKLTFDEGKRIVEHSGELIPLDIDLPNDPTVVAMIVEYNRLKNIRLGGVRERISPIPATFLVAAPANCSTCHQDQFDHWSTTAHARSFETLIHDHKEKSPDCLACHTTGFGRDDGYLNYNLTAGLKNVNCTECHYVPALHVAEPALAPSEPLAEGQCLRCHDQANSPGFEFASFVSEIRHPVTVVMKQAEVAAAETGPAVVGTGVGGEGSEWSDSFLLHRVEAGESLWWLAKRYLDNGSRWERIYELNREDIDNPHLIVVGQMLKIPGSVARD